MGEVCRVITDALQEYANWAEKCECETPPRLSEDLRASSDYIKYLQEKTKITGETSDGYHTFDELYHHRAILFSVIVHCYRARAWKSKLHDDGTMYDGMFVVGIDTPAGFATYHYDIEEYWDKFDCIELDHAPKWDGHTPAQAIERIGTLCNLRVVSQEVFNQVRWERDTALNTLEQLGYGFGQIIDDGK